MDAAGMEAPAGIAFDGLGSENGPQRLHDGPRTMALRCDEIDGVLEALRFPGYQVGQDGIVFF